MTGYPIQLPQAHLDAINGGERAEELQRKDKLAEAQHKAELAAQMAQIAEYTMLYRTGHTQAEWRQAAGNIAVAKEMRNRQGEWGSAERSAVLITGADGRLTELKPREEAAGPVTVRADSPQAQLARARNADPDGFMAEQVRRFDERREADRRAERAAETRRLEAEVRSGLGYGRDIRR